MTSPRNTIHREVIHQERIVHSVGGQNQGCAISLSNAILNLIGGFVNIFWFSILFGMINQIWLMFFKCFKATNQEILWVTAIFDIHRRRWSSTGSVIYGFNSLLASFGWEHLAPQKGGWLPPRPRPCLDMTTLPTSPLRPSDTDLCERSLGFWAPSWWPRCWSLVWLPSLVKSWWSTIRCWCQS